MDLPFCQKQNPTFYRQIVTNLLRSSDSYDTPSRDYLEVAQYLSSLRFVNLREYYFIICANDEDEFDFHVINPFCNNRLEIVSDYDEDYDNPIMCDLCERDILPDTYKKQRYFSLEVKVNHLKVIEWFEKQLASLKITCNKVATGVYYVIVDTSLISLIIPECRPDNSYSAVDKLKTTPTALITFNKESLKPPLNLHIVPIADLICEDQSLNEVLHQTVEKGVPELLPNVSFQAFNCYSYIPLQQTKSTPAEKTFQLHIKGNDICVNGIGVIETQSKSGRIFFIFLDQFFHDFKSGISPEQYKTLNVGEIANRLENIHDVEQQIRKPINRMQKTIAEKLAITLGLNVKKDDIIQTLPWSGIGTKEYGYRLNPFTIVLKK